MPFAYNHENKKGKSVIHHYTFFLHRQSCKFIFLYTAIGLMKFLDFFKYLKMTKKILFVLFLFVSLSLSAQEESVSGSIRNAVTGEKLAFVNIMVNEGRFGGTTDIDGKFTIKSSEKVKKLTFSYVGFEKLTIDIQDVNDFFEIKMQPISIDLDEVVVLPGINPAHRIIDSVLAHRNQNNPEKLESFTCTIYDKMVLTIDTGNYCYIKKHDTEKQLSDTVANKESKLIEFLDERDFFIMETVTERSFMSPDKNKENVLATKMSGMKDPFFIYLLSEVQSTSFYVDMIHIFNKNYVSPISPGSQKKYLFILESAMPLENHDTIFTISYRPFINTNFDGLEGVLTIHSDGWAIQNVKANPYKGDKGLSIRIQQLYEKIDGIQWFPVQLNTDLIFYSAALVNGNKQYPILGVGKSYLKDIVINPELDKKQFSNISIDVDPYAGERDDSYWNDYRIDSLTERVKATYGFMDSVSKEVDFDRLARVYESLMLGAIPIGKINLDLDKIINFNNAQGFYLGLGLSTNQKFSRVVKIGGFWGYGFGDKTANFGLNTEFTLNRFKEMTFKVSASRESVPFGGFAQFSGSNFVWSGNSYKNFFVNRVTLSDMAEMQFAFRALQHFKFFVKLGIHEKTATNYTFEPDAQTQLNKFRFTNVKLNMRFAFKEKFMQTTKGIQSMGTDYPVVWFGYTRGLKNVLGGEYNYNKYEFQLDESWYIRYLGKTNIVVQMGFIDGKLPLTEYFNMPGTWSNFELYAPQSFATMRINEFFSDRFAALYFTHNFGKLLFKKGKFQPQFIIATNIGWGDISNTEYHSEIEVNSMNKGYYESGLLIDLINIKIAKLGVGAFYRYGPYSYSQEWKNFGWKYTLTIGL